MGNRVAPFTQADVTRAVKGAVAAGLTVREVIATAQGVHVICGDDQKARSANTFDEALRV
jgi:hypothetical protein